MMVLYYWDLLSVDHLPIEASSIDQTQQSGFHLRTREEPSLEMLWFKKIRTMDKFQITDPNNFVFSFNKFPTLQNPTGAGQALSI
jgi:hypothetical protein